MKIIHDELMDLWNSNEQVLDELIEVGRWHVLHRLVFKKDEKLWECHFREPTNEEWDEEEKTTRNCQLVVRTAQAAAPRGHARQVNSANVMMVSGL